MNKVTLLGAGPGELDLLTIKGVDALKDADCIIYDRLLNPDMLKLAPDTCECIYVGKQNHKHTMPQDDINKLLVEKANQYNHVVRLKGGDPYVFGRGGEEALYLKSYGIEVEVIPGISSSIAALAMAGIPITHRGLSKGFQVITAHSKKDSLADIDYSSLLDEDVTLVFLMGLAHVGEIATGLIRAGRASNTPAAVVSNGTTNHQKKVLGTLENIESEVINSDIDSPAIIVVGKVVSLANELDFFENRPLFGKRYLLPKIKHFTYSFTNGSSYSESNQLEEQLINNGAEVISIITGTIMPEEVELSFLDNNNGSSLIVFTSANGVSSFFYNLDRQGMDMRNLLHYKFAVIGQKTKNALLEYGIKADIISKKQNGDDLAMEINNSTLNIKDIYWFTTLDHSDSLSNTLKDNYNLHIYNCYSNIKDKITIDESLHNEIDACDGIIFTSGSNAKAIIPLISDIMPRKIYSIGPTCSKCINGLGYDELIEADVSSYEGLMERILCK
ncbi:MAG: uroporphyrinogen-III C-methyltransferase [Pseudobutyrivibrio sp.]|nr:uroporphyrinogen-III C-methyltransferase [Pseudobutyrivibrio sp.]